MMSRRRFGQTCAGALAVTVVPALADDLEPLSDSHILELMFFAENMELARFQAYAGFERCRMVVRHHEQNDPDHPHHALYRRYVEHYRTETFPGILPRYAREMPPVLRALEAQGRPYEFLPYTMTDGTSFAAYLASTPMDADGIPL